MLAQTAAFVLLGLLLGTALAPLRYAALGGLTLATVLVLGARYVGGRTARASIVVTLLGALVGIGLCPPSPPALPVDGPLRVTVERQSDRGAILRGPGGTRLRADVALEPGASLQLVGTVRSRARFRNPSPHGAWPELAPVAYRVERLRSADVLSSPSPYRRAITAIDSRVRTGLRSSLPPEAFGVARALVLGESEALEDDAESNIRAAGLSHVLAVSGMHVTLIVGALVFLLRLALVRIGWLAGRVDVRRVACAVGVPLALLYADLAGSTPSAWRAAITMAIAWAVIAVGRKPAPLPTTALAALVLAGLDPAAALSPGFVLSIASTIAILGIVRDRPTDESPLTEATRIATRAAIATAPFTLYVFGGMPWLVVLANVVVVPVAAALLLPVAIVHALVVAVDPALGAPTAALFVPLSSAFVGASELFASISPSVAVAPPTTLQGAVLAIAAVGALARLTAARRLGLLLAALFAYGALEAHVRFVEQPTGALRVTFLDVGQGDAALVDLPDGSLLVIDTGGAPGGGPDPGARVLVPTLRARRRTAIAHLVLSHPHPDHYGGLPALDAAFPIGALWDTAQAGSENPEGELAGLLSRMSRRGVRVLLPDAVCGGPRELGGAWVEVLAPCPRFDPGYDPNDNSFVLRLRYGRRTILFAGDAEAHEETGLLGRVGHIDVLKVAHHGSRTSSAAALLDELRPRMAIISVGSANRFGHPHPEVLARYAARGIPLFRTDVEGGVVVTTDGSRTWADSWSGRHLGPSAFR